MSGYMGTECPARHTVEQTQSGTILVKFYGRHNHDVQSFFAMNFVNPIHSCREIGDMVDNKLLAGVQDSGQIMQAVRDHYFKDRCPHKKLFVEKHAYHMAIGLKKHHINNRRKELNIPGRNYLKMDDDDAKSVWKLVDTWKRDPNFDNPVQYYKPAGLKNADTDETIRAGQERPDFSQHDFEQNRILY